jgi:hypothetical protein
MGRMRRRDFAKTMAAAATGLLLGAQGRLWAQAGRPDVPVMRPQLKPEPDVKRVLVMFKCHFDAGFIDTQANVVKRYFREYFPRAIEIARKANEGGRRQYVWTTGSWLLYEYLEQASEADRKAMEAAIARGDITWHALPFTWQTEMMGRSLIEGSLALSKSLDKRFGKVTTGAKMTDVPGHTRGLIAPLARHGVGFLEIGVNGGSTVAKLPPVFLWKSAGGASLPVMYHWDYSGTARVPGSDVVLATRVRGDNAGPHTMNEIGEVRRELAQQFPNAEVSACSLSQMAEAVAPHRDALPVVTAEIGDTWIYGVASDPVKVARYREIARLRESWLSRSEFQPGDATDVALLRRLLLEVEHTWGTDTKTWLDFDNYKPADLKRMLDTKNYRVVQFSWQEKRQDLLDGVATLPDALRAEAGKALDALKPVEPAIPAQPHAPGKPIEGAHFVLDIDGRTGAITRLRNKATGREWASDEKPIGLFAYQTLSKDDYDRFIKSYLTTTEDWAYKDFGKPNIERLGAESRTWLPASASVHVEETPEAHRVLIQPRFEDEAAFESGRAAFPRKVYVELVLPKAEAVIHVTASWFEKPATRLPEALWMTFNPVVADARGWTLRKSDELVSPFDVAESGNRHMHAVSTSFFHGEGGVRFEVVTLDAPLVALGERTPLLFSNQQPDLSRGIHSCLYNNAWGTNYIMWFGEDARFRYEVRA